MDEALEAIVEEWERLRSLELQREHSSSASINSIVLTEQEASNPIAIPFFLSNH